MSLPAPHEGCSAGTAVLAGPHQHFACLCPPFPRPVYLTACINTGNVVIFQKKKKKIGVQLFCKRLFIRQARADGDMRGHSRGHNPCAVSASNPHDRGGHKSLRAGRRGISDGAASKGCLGGWGASGAGEWVFGECTPGRGGLHIHCVNKQGNRGTLELHYRKGKIVPQCSPIPVLAGSNHSSLLSRPSLAATHTKNGRPDAGAMVSVCPSSQAALCLLTGVHCR